MIGDKVGADATAEGGHGTHIAAALILFTSAFWPFGVPFLAPYINGFGGVPPFETAYLPHTLLFLGLGLWRLMKGLNPSEKGPKVYAVYDGKPSIGSTLMALPIFAFFLGLFAFMTSIAFYPEFGFEISPIVPFALEIATLAFLLLIYNYTELDGEKRQVKMPSVFGSTVAFDQIEGVGEIKLVGERSGRSMGWQVGLLLKGEPKARQIFAGSAEQVRATAQAICAKTGLVYLRNPDMDAMTSLLSRYGGLGSSGAGALSSLTQAPLSQAPLSQALSSPASSSPYAPPKPIEQRPLEGEEIQKIEARFVALMQESQKHLLQSFSLHGERAEVIAALRALGEKGTGKALKRIKKDLRDYVMVPQRADEEVKREANAALRTIQARLDADKP